MTSQVSKAALLSVITVLALVTLLHQKASAQETIEATILRIDFDEPTPKPFGYNDQFQLTMRPRSIPSDLQVRVFSGDKQKLAVQKQGWTKADGRCLVYESLVLRPQATRSSLNFGWNFDSRAAGWLKDAQDTEYLLIFEEGHLPAGQVKIFKNDVESYFSSGFEIKLLAEGFGPPPKPEVPEGSATGGTSSRETATSPGCIHANLALGTGLTVARLRPCRETALDDRLPALEETRKNRGGRSPG